MLPVLIALAMFLLAFAIPYHAPRLGLVGGALGLAGAVLLMRRAPLDFDLNRPVALALTLYALIWLSIATAQLTSVHARAR